MNRSEHNEPRRTNPNLLEAVEKDPEAPNGTSDVEPSGGARKSSSCKTVHITSSQRINTERASYPPVAIADLRSTSGVSQRSPYYSTFGRPTPVGNRCHPRQRCAIPSFVEGCGELPEWREIQDCLEKTEDRSLDELLQYRGGAGSRLQENQPHHTHERPQLRYSGWSPGPIAVAARLREFKWLWALKFCKSLGTELAWTKAERGP